VSSSNIIPARQSCRNRQLKGYFENKHSPPFEKPLLNLPLRGDFFSILAFPKLQKKPNPPHGEDLGGAFSYRWRLWSKLPEISR